MPGSREKPWSSNPNAPKISHKLYLLEKAWFAGTLISSILYGTRNISIPSLTSTRAHCTFVPFTLGMLIVLFFNCMAALFSPAHRRGEGIKRGLVIYTVIMFSLVTVYTATKDHILSICYIDNREFPDHGPWRYHEAMAYAPILIIARAAYSLSNWLADGLLVSSPFNAVAALPGA